MTVKYEIETRDQAALDELRSLISQTYPDATFAVTFGDDPPGIFLMATVDADDMERVAEVYQDRLIDLQVEDGLRIYVVPRPPYERTIKELSDPGPRDASLLNEQPGVLGECDADRAGQAELDAKELAE